ncbi:hypothetical protein AVEN_92727-1 [Araneus ventricosus]|uniref:Paired domain-containing protein n=1 Tax=Araneus ventricosus TaxID=182803 RepID=A0A4Y2IDI3_ARAVE|nr:hypothetical protein AVEN_92727-1 [Araneus ventricosus]
MSNHQRLDDRMRWRIVGRLEAGQSQVQICGEFNVTPSFVSNLWKQFQDTGSIERKPGQSRPEVTTANEDPYLSMTMWKLQLLSSLVTSMRSQEAEFQGLLFP